MSPHSDSFTGSGNSPTNRPDFICSGYGSLYLLRPLNQTTRLWIETHIQSEHQTFADSVVIEHRYIRASLLSSTMTVWRCLVDSDQTGHI
jgi:hypothetical protein